jgi:enoyl-CoA hydratase/carnithine racemase
MFRRKLTGMAEPLVKVERLGPVAIVSLNRPERHNALVPELLSDLLAALAGERSLNAAAVVLRAEGPNFSTGGDLAGFWQNRESIAQYSFELVGLLNEAILALYTHPAPLICAVEGQLTGGSLGLSMACDRVIMHKDASVTPYYSVVGFSPDGGWTAMLPDIIGRQQAMHWLATNARRGAADCRSLGLAQAVVEENCDDAALAWASSVSGMSADSIGSTKRLLKGDCEALSRRLEAEREAFVAQVRTPRALAGIEQFLGRNKP